MTTGPAATDSAARDALPVVTFAALLLVALLNGSIIAETVFGWPGLGLLVINLKTARALGLTMPPVLLIRADRVIQ